MAAIAHLIGKGPPFQVQRRVVHLIACAEHEDRQVRNALVPSKAKRLFQLLHTAVAAPEATREQYKGHL